MRIIIQARGRNIIDLGLMTPVRKPAPDGGPDRTGPDAHGTVAAQVEQADEPAPGFGFGSIKTIVSREQPGS